MRFAIETVTQPHPDNNISSKKYYLVCESPGSPAFSHWIFEFFIPHYGLLQKLVQDRPDLLWIVFSHQRYLKNFLIYVGVASNQIVIASDTTNPHVSVLPTQDNFGKHIRFHDTHNTVFFPSLYSHNDKSIAETRWTTIFNGFDSRHNIPYCEKHIPFLYLPRNNKDNFITDRNAQYCTEFEEWIIKRNGMIVDTYTLNNIFLQVQIIRSSEVIVLYSGSSYIVNGFLARGSSIVMIDEIGIRGQSNIYPFYKAVHEYICLHNRVTILNNLSDFFTHCFHE
jgi:hypothetical protein